MKKRARKDLKTKADYLHFGWVDFIDGYHKAVKAVPYSVYGIITFLKSKSVDKIIGLDHLEGLYKSCHAYTHGSIQTAKYPVLHYFEILIMLYYVTRDTFLLICREKGVEALVNGSNIISMIDRDFEVLYGQYKIRTTDMFERYYASGLS